MVRRASAAPCQARCLSASACRQHSGSFPLLPGLSGVPVDGGFETVNALKFSQRLSRDHLLRKSERSGTAPGGSSLTP